MVLTIPTAGCELTKARWLAGNPDLGDSTELAELRGSEKLASTIDAQRFAVLLDHRGTSKLAEPVAPRHPGHVPPPWGPSYPHIPSLLPSRARGA